MVLSFVCFVLSDLLNRIWEDRGSSRQKLGCSEHLSSLHHQLVKHLSPQNVIFPIRISPIHKVWRWSLGGQGHPDRSWDVQDTYLHCMINFCSALVSPKCHFTCQDDPNPQSLELESRRTGVILTGAHGVSRGIIYPLTKRHRVFNENSKFMYV